MDQPEQSNTTIPCCRLVFGCWRFDMPFSPILPGTSLFWQRKGYFHNAW
jgi:hypothetical protein